MATREFPKPSADVLDPSELIAVLSAFKSGDFTARMRPDKIGLAGKVADALNEIIERNQRLAHEFTRTYDAVAREGRIAHRAILPMASGDWATCVDSVNQLV